MSPFDGTHSRRSTGRSHSDATAWQAYRTQSLPAQRLFGLLRSLPGADHGTAGLAAAMALGDAETSTLLSALGVAGLIATTDGSEFDVTDSEAAASDVAGSDLSGAGFGDGWGEGTRYRVSEIGTALRPEWSGAEARSVHRWYDWCLAHVSVAADILYPQALRLESSVSTTIPAVVLVTPAQASNWLAAETPTICAAIGDARRHGLGRFAWLLADAMRGWVWQQPYGIEWIGAAHAAIAAARAAGNPRASAAAYLVLADAHFLAGEFDQAEDACAAVGANAARAGWLSGSAASHANRGGIHHRRGSYMEALGEYTKALELFGAAGRTVSQASLLNNIGGVLLTLGDTPQAVAFHRRALVQFRQLGSLAGEARSLEMMAQACTAGGQREAAERALVQAFMVYGRLGDRVGEERTRRSARTLSEIRESPAA